ncbi:MAG: PilT/PilU family type 4a pilus ATPase [Planctomycetota bacterium]
MEQMLLGEILVNFHLLTQEELDRCLKIQEQMDPRMPLGEIIVQRGLLEQGVIDTVLTAQRKELDTQRCKLTVGERELARMLENASSYEFLEAIKQLGVSDFYLTSGSSPAVRLHGRLVDLPVKPLPFRQCRNLIFSLLTREQMATYFERKSLDTGISIPGVGRFRVNVFRHLGGIGAVFRVLPDSILPFEDLGLPEVVKTFSEFKSGLVLITGTTASGKTTTLASLIDLINRSRRAHVITLEDPVEQVHRSDKALVTQREINSHTLSYPDALRAALREDPDILVVGEMRDPETMAVALTAAETGHLVFGTLHTRTAHNTVVRIIDQFPQQKRQHVRTMIAGVLRAVICQELIPHVDGEGRSLAAEVMVVNPAISNLIREGREWQIPMVMQMNQASGSQTMDDALHRLVRQRKVPIEEALLRAAEKERFMAPV